MSKSTLWTLAAFLGLLTLIAVQAPVLQDYDEWLWQGRLWSQARGLHLLPALNLGFLVPYALGSLFSPRLAALSGYLFWGLAGAWLFQRRGGWPGLSVFLAFLAFPCFYWIGNIAFINACVFALLFISLSERSSRLAILGSVACAMAAACLHGAVGLALLIYALVRTGLALLRQAWRPDQRFAWSASGLVAVFAAAALLSSGPGIHLEWGSAFHRLMTLSWAFSPLSVPDALLGSSVYPFLVAALVLLLAAALVNFIRLLGPWAQWTPGQWACLAVLAAGLGSPLLAFEVVRLDLRLLFCAYAMALYTAVGQTGFAAKAPRFAWACFLVVGLGVLVNLHYDRALRSTLATAGDFLRTKTVVGAYMEPVDGDRIWNPLPNYSAHKFFFEYPDVLPMPQYLFRTLFDQLPQAAPNGKPLNRLSRPIDGYPQTVCVVYRDR